MLMLLNMVLPLREVNNRWLKEGDEKITNMPRTFTSYMLEQYQKDP